MRRIGIDQALGEVYDSAGNYWRIALPAPLITGAILDPTFPVECRSLDQAGWTMFREDHFDLTARVRRGRFYMPAPGQRPSPQHVLPRHAGDSVQTVIGKSLFVYDEYHLLPTSKPPKLVALGSSGFISLWQVAAPPERISTGELLFVLKARHGFGILPEVDHEKIPEAGRAKAVETLEALTDAAHRESPGSMIDRARDAAQWCLAIWAAARFKEESLLREDLGSLIQKISKKQEMVALRAAQIVQRLHSRVKPNEQERYGFRPPMEDDAELALKSVGFLLRELGWTKA